MALETRSLAQFDRLVETGELLWKEVPARHIASQPFNFEFRVAAALAKKPMTATQKKVVNAFADSNPDFSLGLVGSKHKLILNKFCVVRPQFVLHTIDFVPQKQALDAADLGALWHVLTNLKSEHIAIFNCGAEAGASVGHKHMQVLPRSPHAEFQLFPDIDSVEEGIYSVQEIPFKHAIHRLPETVNESTLVNTYHNLLSHLSLGQEAPHNFILTKTWILVIPRIRGRVGNLAANAAAMVGMVWVTSEEEYQGWTAQDPMTLLPSFGVQIEEVSTNQV
ncbi:hypothetical protein DM02DRAFT_572482 [Periconia macrospinosa]|uniref:Uncharacterized protein n=1 Tax=Periconia macrospinosa TaxID=97972 RepID=A0A2V1D9I0_9PLEO|nr:hypothetical protein DM02DRAFT_572482 [Periconia macrospinosa]